MVAMLFRLPERQRDLVLTLAGKKGVTPSAYLRTVVEAHLKSAPGVVTE